MGLTNNALAYPSPHEEPDEVGRILYVDDEPLVRSAFARSVRRRGFVVDVAANADEALTLVQEHDYALIATDLGMPGRGGISLIRELHNNKPESVFIIVTGGGLDVPLDPELRKSVASIVQKPWDLDEVVAVLRRSIRR